MVLFALEPTHGVALVRIYNAGLKKNWNVLHAVRWKCRTQRLPKIRHLGTIAQLTQAIS